MVFAPCFTTTRSAMYFASNVAVAVAPATPGMGNVTTGLPPSHDRLVPPAVVTPSLMNSAGLGPSSVMSPTAASAAFGAPCGPAHRRISRSWTAAAIGVALPFPARSSAPGMSSFQAYSPLTTSMPVCVCPLGRVHVYCTRCPGVW